jgi:uncharacterized protein (TIRG00374 family)
MNEATSNNRLRQILLILLFLAFTLLVVSRFTNFSNLVSTLSQGRWPWVLAGVLIHVIYFMLYAVLYQRGFATVEVNTRTTLLIPVMFATMFINAVVPTAGVAGNALFIDHIVKRDQSGARGVVGLFLVLLADLGTMVPFLLFGLVQLQKLGALSAYATLSGSAYVVYIGILISGLVLSAKSPALLKSILTKLRQAVNRIGKQFKRPDLLDETWASRNTNDLKLGANAIREHPKLLTFTLLWAIFLHIINLIGLYAFFVAFNQPISVGGLVAGFSLGIVFFVISVIPQGIGAAEGIMALVYTSIGVPAAKAITIALVFRGVNYWLPVLVGLIAMRKAAAPPVVADLSK